MADRTSAALFADIFTMLAEDPTPKHKTFARKLFEKTHDYDFLTRQMYCDEALAALGFEFDSEGDLLDPADVNAAAPFDQAIHDRDVRAAETAAKALRDEAYAEGYEAARLEFIAKENRALDLASAAILGLNHCVAGDEGANEARAGELAMAALAAMAKPLTLDELAAKAAASKRVSR